MGESPTARHAIFGGSFDPVHLGHLGMARAAMEEGRLDRVLFMPCFVSPFKSSTVATGLQRAKMIQLALEDEHLEGAEVSTFEINRDQPSYSWETATHFKNHSPEVEWHWILGTDQWNSIDRWANPEILCDLLHFVIMTRNDEPVVERPGWRSETVAYEHPASSTAIRSDIEAHDEWLTPSVRDFCQAEGLYRD